MNASSMCQNYNWYYLFHQLMRNIEPDFELKKQEQYVFKP